LPGSWRASRKSHLTTPGAPQPLPSSQASPAMSPVSLVEGVFSIIDYRIYHALLALAARHSSGRLALAGQAGRQAGGDLCRSLPPRATAVIAVFIAEGRATCGLHLVTCNRNPQRIVCGRARCARAPAHSRTVLQSIDRAAADGRAHGHMGTSVDLWRSLTLARLLAHCI
jgi:hypothetical protein